MGGDGPEVYQGGKPVAGYQAGPEDSADGAEGGGRVLTLGTCIDGKKALNDGHLPVNGPAFRKSG